MISPFGEKGSKTIQKQELEVHQNYEAHKRANEKLKWQKRAPCKVIEKQVDLMVDVVKKCIVTCMQIMWHVVKHAMSLESYEDQ